MRHEVKEEELLEKKEKNNNNSKEDDEFEVLNSGEVEVVSSTSYLSLLTSQDRDFLLSPTGTQVEVSDLEGKVIGLYFSANWYLPCQNFTQVLVNAYEQLKICESKFEVVFVSSDEDLEAFNNYRAGMPWLAIPFSDLESKKALNRRFDIEGIPCLIILQPNGRKDDDGILHNGVEMIYRYGVQAFPFSKERLEELEEEERERHESQTLINLLTNHDRDFLLGHHPMPKQVPVGSLTGKTVGLYFSAQWCLPGLDMQCVGAMVGICSRSLTKTLVLNLKPAISALPPTLSPSFSRLQVRSLIMADSAFKKIQIQRDDTTFDAYVVGKEDAPGIVVLQEWWGVDFEIRNHALKVSQFDSGYKALIPDLYRGKVGLDAAEAQHLMDGLDWQGAVKDIRASVNWLKANGSQKVGVTGFCMGGALSIASSVLVPEVDAVVAFYGVPSSELADPAHAKAPVQAHFGELDSFVGFSDVTAAKALEEKLKASGVPYEVLVYPRNAHAFMNKSPEGVERRKGMGWADDDEAAVELAWSRFRSWMSRFLSP